MSKSEPVTVLRLSFYQSINRPGDGCPVCPRGVRASARLARQAERMGAGQGRAAVIAQPDSQIDPQPATHPRLPSQGGRQVNNNLRIMCLTKPTTHPEKKAKSGPPPRLTRHLSRRASTVSRLGRQARQSRRRLWLACSRQAVRSWRLCQPFCTPLKDPVHKSGRQPRNHSALHWAVLLEVGKLFQLKPHEKVDDGGACPI